jgi:hypothetical protein
MDWRVEWFVLDSKMQRSDFDRRAESEKKKN